MICIHVGCRLSKLYTVGRIATIPCGGAETDNLEIRLMKDATSAAGRYVEERKRSESRRKRARYRVWNKVGVNKA
jgi:hypothetical protein